MYRGVDYYPEHWGSNLIDEDLKRFKAMNINLLRIGEFAWWLMEKEEGKFDFTYFDELIKKAKTSGFKIMFGTPTATFPAWLGQKHPSIFLKQADKLPKTFGGRRLYCYNSDIYLDYASKITRELVSHYRNEDTIVSWQIDNEIGHETSDMCYCEECHRKFHIFLENKYKDIDTLNDTYGTIFWGQNYNDFREIPLPVPTITTHNPSLVLDYSRFRSETIAQFLRKMIKVIKDNCGPNQLVTHDFPGGGFTKYYDHNDASIGLDFISFNNYPVWGGLKEPISPSAIAIQLDFNRGILNKHFTITEQLMGAQGHTIIGYLPRPNQTKMWSYQTLAHGCDNLFYFRERGMNKGAEQFCYGIIDHDNLDNRKVREVQSFFEETIEIEDVINAPVKSDIALIYDFDNIWSWFNQPQSTALDITTEFLRLYEPFFNLNLNIDVIRYDRDFKDYKVLLVPILQIIDEGLAKRLMEFTANGGTVIFSFRSGIRDKDNNIYFGLPSPCHISELCGIKIYEVESLQIGQSVEIISPEYIKGEAKVWRDLITCETAKPLFTYNDQFFDGMAAITVNNYGLGNAYYIGCGVNDEIMEDIAIKVCNNMSINYLISPNGIEIKERYVNDQCYYFVMNHTAESKVLNHFNIILKPYEAKVIKGV